MIPLIRALLFLVAFTLEIRVHAAEVVTLPVAHHVVQEPEHCVAKIYPCVVRTRPGEKLAVALEGASVLLDGATAVILETPRESVILEGGVLVRGSGAIRIRSAFGSARGVGKENEFLVRQESGRTRVLALRGSVEISPRGSVTALGIDSGEENWMGRVSSSGHADTGVPRAAVIDELLPIWARLFEGSAKAFEKEVRRFHKSWVQASDAAAALHLDLAQRRIASIEEKRKAREIARKKVEERNEFFRALFRRKNGLD